jgi:hypothetical protein
VSDEATPDEAVEESEGTVIEVPLTLEGEAERQDLHCLCECRKTLHEGYNGNDPGPIEEIDRAIKLVLRKGFIERYRTQGQP